MLRHFFHLGRAYFELDHRQAKAYLWLLFLTAAIVCSPLLTYYLYPAPYGEQDIQLILYEADSAEVSAVSTVSGDHPIFQKYIDQMHEEDWIKTGLPIFLAKRIGNYQRKVKPLKRVNDLYAIYGLDSSRIALLVPYLKEAAILSQRKEKKKPETQFVVLDINTADSNMLEALPAIGPVLSKRILKYRELLKGYVSKTQYAEIYGISPEALAILQKWTEVKAIPVVCSIQSADYQKLNAHFYLSGKDARFIISQLKTKSLCWDDLQPGLEPKAQTHIAELKLYFPCD